MKTLPASPLFALDDVTVRLGDRTVLRNLSWSLEPGQVAVILGPSGSGKSVFLSTLLGFLEPASGVVHRPAPNRNDLFRRVGVVFQEDALLDDRSVEANLAVALTGDADEFGSPDSPEQSSKIDAVLADVALNPGEVRHLKPGDLSGGMRRRVALARALLRRPEVLIADEPTSGLDAGTARAIYALMKQLIESRGMSGIIITHDPVCAEVLGNPAYTFAPLEGALYPWPSSTEELSPKRSDDADSAQRPSPESPSHASWPNFFQSAGDALDGIGRSVLSLRHLAAIPSLGLLRRGLTQWGLRSAPLVALIFLIVGFVVLVQAERAIVDLGFSNRMPELFALALSRSSPLIVAILLAGRSGSTATAQTGWRVYSAQYRALETLGVNPDRTFFPPLFWSWILAAPALLLLGLLSAHISALIFLASPLSRAQITPTFFLNEVPTYFDTATSAVMLFKTLAMAGGAATIAYVTGASPKRSSEEVMSGMTRALVTSFVWLALVDLLLSLFA